MLRESISYGQLLLVLLVPVLFEVRWRVECFVDKLPGLHLHVLLEHLHLFVVGVQCKWVPCHHQVVQFWQLGHCVKQVFLQFNRVECEVKFFQVWKRLILAN